MPLLFSYGTLQQDDIQLATYGRRLDGHRDALVGFLPAVVKIEDSDLVARLGKTHHHNVTPSEDPASRVFGMVFEISDAELANTDEYEAEFRYERVTASLASGRQAWVYVHVVRPRA
ncbi:MAG: gamma-glutamylcyclotransferase family protein [Acidobacteriota bacterium]|nr:gamma-glutamylcyclotransferase family protein [Acidobacteriota bacterium]